LHLMQLHLLYFIKYQYWLEKICCRKQWKP